MMLLARFGVAALALGTVLPALGAALAEPPRQDASAFKYAGMARCNTKDCHGSDVPKGSPALNEYNLWKGADPHSRAFTTLYKAPSKAIGQAMGIAKVHESAKCLSCHSRLVEPEKVMANVKWSLQNGVSCELCHGPSEKWIEPHALPKEKKWSHEKSMENGMIDLRDPARWASHCASCHLQIDHDLVAAGHPKLHFELVDYNARTGAHWKTEKHPSMAAGFDAKMWTTGQVVSLAEALRNLARHVKAGAKKELTDGAREQAAAYARVLQHAGEIPADAAKLEELAAVVEAKLKGLAPADESLLKTLAAGEAPRDFSAARQVALAFRALSTRAAAKADLDKLCEQILAKNEKAFDAAKFAAGFDAVRAHFK